MTAASTAGRWWLQAPVSGLVAPQNCRQEAQESRQVAEAGAAKHTPFTKSQQVGNAWCVLTLQIHGDKGHQPVHTTHISTLRT